MAKRRFLRLFLVHRALERDARDACSSCETMKRIHPALFATCGLVLGVWLGLWYGWRVSPVRYVSTTPDLLRQDYRDDYVLMVAEATPPITISDWLRNNSLDWVGPRWEPKCARPPHASSPPGTAKRTCTRLYRLAADLETAFGSAGDGP